MTNICCTVRWNLLQCGKYTYGLNRRPGSRIYSNNSSGSCAKDVFSRFWIPSKHGWSKRCYVTVTATYLKIYDMDYQDRCRQIYIYHKTVPFFGGHNSSVFTKPHHSMSESLPLSAGSS